MSTEKSTQELVRAVNENNLLSTPIVAVSAEDAIKEGKKKIGVDGKYTIMAEHSIGDLTAYLVACEPSQTAA